MKNTNPYYKLAAFTFVIMLIVNVFQFLFILLPIYELAGSLDADVSERLTHLQQKAKVAKWVTLAFLAVSLLSLVMGWKKSAPNKHGRLF